MAGTWVIWLLFTCLSSPRLSCLSFPNSRSASSVLQMLYALCSLRTLSLSLSHSSPSHPHFMSPGDSLLFFPVFVSRIPSLRFLLPPNISEFCSDPVLLPAWRGAMRGVETAAGTQTGTWAQMAPRKRLGTSGVGCSLSGSAAPSLPPPFGGKEKGSHVYRTRASAGSPQLSLPLPTRQPSVLSLGGSGCSEPLAPDV